MAQTFLIQEKTDELLQIVFCRNKNDFKMFSEAQFTHNILAHNFEIKRNSNKNIKKTFFIQYFFPV
jgi:hypothetical protein